MPRTSFLSEFSGLATALALLVGTAATGIAQTTSGGDLTEEQLRQKFEQQTRGLVLAPTTQQPKAETASATPAESTYVEVEKELQVNIQITFDFDSAALRADQKPRLEALCNVIKTSDIPKFRIVGHTDASGSASYNEQLSILRAKEVKRHMVSECGVPDTKLEAIGVGEAYPVNTDDPRADENRRVEFQALS